MWKQNYCSDVVSPRDIEIMEMLEWCRLITERGIIDDKLHNCEFTANMMAEWKGHV